MKVLRGISPRLFSICFNSDIGRVIPSFSVLSTSVVPIIPIYVIVLSYKRFHVKENELLLVAPTKIKINKN
jgi:hypothetical protein